MTYSLAKADSKEFARWWVVYRNANEDFSQSFAEQARDIVDVPYCHWVLAEGQRVGGLITVANNIGDFFLIHPFTDAESVLSDVLPGDKPFYARGILTEHVPAFEKQGFNIMESRRWMLRPTQPHTVTLNYPRTSPESAQAGGIADLMYAAFHGGVGQYGRRDVDAHRASVDDYFETVESADVCQRASSLLHDGERLIAACLVQPYKSFATIRFVVTHPAYQRQGLARGLIDHAIDTVKDDYGHITLAVTVGNPAEQLYDTMGFMPGVILHTLGRM